MIKRSKILYTILLFILLFIPPLIAYNYYELPGIKGYKPPEGFPWDNKPRTAEEIVYLTHSNHYAPDNLDNHFVVSFEVNKRGHITYKQWLTTWQNLYDDYLKIYLPLARGGKGIAPGTVIGRVRAVYIYPPELRGTGFLWWHYLNTPYHNIGADTWLYLAPLRRVRRLGAAERADSVGGSLYSYDDMMGREIFEHDYKIIGEDRITDFPWDLKYAQLFEPGWTPPEAIDTVVIESKPKLPDYYLSKRILWIDKKRWLIVREEQYDRDGYLWKIFTEQHHYVTDPKTGKKLLIANSGYLQHYDPNIEFRSFSYQEYSERGEKAYSLGDAFHTPEAMKQETYYRKTIPLYPPPPPELNVSTLPPKIPLWIGKFPEYRKIRPDTLKRLGITK